VRLLLDEDVPVQLLGPLRHLLREHVVDHVQYLGWKGKKTDSSSRTARRAATTRC